MIINFNYFHFEHFVFFVYCLNVLKVLILLAYRVFSFSLIFNFPLLAWLVGLKISLYIRNII